MPLIILGLIFAIGLFLFYIFSTSSSNEEAPASNEKARKNDGDLKTKENVIYLPDDVQKIKDKRKRKK